MKLKTKILIGILYYFAFFFIIGSIMAGKEGLLSLPVGLAIGYFTYRYMKRKQAEAEELELEQEQEQEQLDQTPASSPSEPRHLIKLVAPDEDEKEDDDEEDDEFEEMEYSIKGINYANIDDSYLGDHDGYIKAITNNPKDPYAIGVFIGKKRVGWLPAGNRQLHEGLLSIGGKAKVHVFISKSYDDYDNHQFYYGKAIIPNE